MGKRYLASKSAHVNSMDALIKKGLFPLTEYDISLYLEKEYDISVNEMEMKKA